MARKAERVTASVTHHGECPFWDAPRNRLLCADVLNGTIVSVDSAGVIKRYPIPSPVVTVIRRRRSAGFVITTEHGLITANEELSEFQQFVEILDDPLVRTNDGGCDPLGAMIIGTMAYDGRPDGGSVYRVTPERDVMPIVSPVSISNGIQWSEDGTRVYYVDTPTRQVDVFDVDPVTGAWTGRRPHIPQCNIPGFPDGVAIDEEDGLWIALWGRGAVAHYDAAGYLVETIEVPGVTQTSSCTFGGTDLSTLYITTSRQDLAERDEPAAGAVFGVETRIRGALQRDFAG
jgi:sugar lactone lactonase YvrE